MKISEQWRGLAAWKQNALVVAVALGVGFGLAKLAEQPAPQETVIIQPGYFVCVTGTGQPTAMFPDVLTSTGRESDGLIHWSLIVKDYGELLYIQSPGEACKVKPIVPAQRAAVKAVAPKMPRFNL